MAGEKTAGNVRMDITDNIGDILGYDPDSNALPDEEPLTEEATVELPEYEMQQVPMPKKPAASGGKAVKKAVEKTIERTKRKSAPAVKDPELEKRGAAAFALSPEEKKALLEKIENPGLHRDIGRLLEKSTLDEAERTELGRLLKIRFPKE
jgi:hypothetical protein